MTKSRALVIVSLALILVLLHVAGLTLEFYWRIGWYDRVVHTLAGVTAALGVFSLNSTRNFSKQPLWLFLGALLVSLIVGILWELFEVKAGITSVGDRGYLLDTSWDIVCDVLGGVLASGYIFIFG